MGIWCQVRNPVHKVKCLKTLVIKKLNEGMTSFVAGMPVTVLKKRVVGFGNRVRV